MLCKVAFWCFIYVLIRWSWIYINSEVILYKWILVVGPKAVVIRQAKTRYRSRRMSMKPGLGFPAKFSPSPSPLSPSPPPPLYHHPLRHHIRHHYHHYHIPMMTLMMLVMIAVIMITILTIVITTTATTATTTCLLFLQERIFSLEACKLTWNKVWGETCYANVLIIFGKVVKIAQEFQHECIFQRTEIEFTRVSMSCFALVTYFSYTNNNSSYEWWKHAKDTSPNREMTLSGRCVKRPYPTIQLCPIDTQKTGACLVMIDLIHDVFISKLTNDSNFTQNAKWFALDDE